MGVITIQIAVNKIDRNKGQIEGLPKNPRLIRDEKFELLKRSIQENPEMLGLRELLVYPVGERYVIIGGNMRYEACKALGYTSIPCKVLDADTPVETLRAYTIKDNAGFGEWDWDAIANEWNEKEVADWGLDVPEWDTKEDDGQGGGAAAAGNDNFKYESQYGVIVMCPSEGEQEQVYNKLTIEGYSCKVVSV